MSSPEAQDLERLLTAAEALPQQVLSIYDYAERLQPNAVFVCDRDARPVGIALAGIRARVGGLHSVGDRWYNRRISNRLSSDEIAAHLEEPLTKVKTSAEKPVIMVVDDYVSARARTLYMFQQICRRQGLSAYIHWATLSGKGTAFNAYPHAGATAMAPWRDRPEVLGFDYDGTTLIEQPTVLSGLFYERLQRAVDQLVIPRL